MFGCGLQQVSLFGIEDEDDDLDLRAEFYESLNGSDCDEFLDSLDTVPETIIHPGVMTRRLKQSDLDIPNNGLLTVDQVAIRFSVDARTVHRWVREERLGCLQLSRTNRLFTEEQIQAFIRSRTIDPPVANVCKKPIDLKSVEALRSKRKGGDESQGEFDRAQLRKEMRQWQ